jgi:ankyrin repeat protein
VTALHLACAQGSASIAVKLVRAGADINIRSSEIFFLVSVSRIHNSSVQGMLHSVVMMVQGLLV